MMLEPSLKNRTILTLIFGVLLVAGIVYLIYSRSATRPIEINQVNIPPAGPIVIEGEITCLPHIDTSGPQTLECAFGLKDDQGRYFALKDNDPSYSNVSNVPHNQPVTVEGNFIPGTDSRYQSIGIIEVTSIVSGRESMRTFSDPEKGVTYQYPTLSYLEYISALDWPPQVQILDEEPACTEAGDENERAGETKSETINGRVYCVTKITEGAAGSMYIQYAYAFPKGDKTVILTFSLRFSQCANYEPVPQEECETERQAFDISSVVDDIAQSLVLNR